MKLYSNALELVGCIMFLLGVAIGLWRAHAAGLPDVVLIGTLLILGAIIAGIGNRRAKKTSARSPTSKKS